MTDGPDDEKKRRVIKIPMDDDALLEQCRVDTFRAGGKGGQHQNTTESGVRITHEPTDVVAEARDARSQHRNRRIALDRLKNKLRQKARQQKPRRKTRVPASEKRRRLREKRHRGRIKEKRRAPRPHDVE